MGVSLYRKYRPQVFSDVQGQDHIIQTLLHQSKRRDFAHAYLFTGPRGVGKTTTARLIAKAVNCEHPKKDGEPDNTCDACASINANKAIDIIEIDAASHTGVDNVRSSIIETTRIHPTQLSYKVFIIDEVHMLSTSAFNALLKTLEEPPSHVLFILATTELHKVPDTIISRCQRFAFHRIPHDILIARLQGIAKKEKIAVDPSVFERIALRSEGSSRDAESILGQLFSFESKHITDAQADLVLPRSSFTDAASLAHHLMLREREKALSFLTAFVEAGGNPEQFLSDCITYVRSMLLLRMNTETLRGYVRRQFPDSIVRHMEKDAELGTEKDIVDILEQLVRAKKSFSYAPIPELALELAVYEICEREKSHDDVPPAGTGSASSEQEQKKPMKESRPPVLKKTTTKQAPRDFSFSIVKEKWQDITNAVRQVNRGLSLSMQVAKPIDIEGATVTLAVPYTFHKERIDIPTHLRLIEETMSASFGKPVKLVCVVQDLAQKEKEKGPNVEKVKGDSLWDQVVDAFGDQLA